MAMGPTQGTEKKQLAGGVIAQYHILKMGADDNHLIESAAATDQHIGVAQHAAAAAEDDIRVQLDGITNLKLGGTVTRGDRITSDANGKGVTAAPAAGTNNPIVGIAFASGVLDDLIPMLLAPQQLNLAVS